MSTFVLGGVSFIALSVSLVLLPPDDGGEVLQLAGYIALSMACISYVKTSDRFK